MSKRNGEPPQKPSNDYDNSAPQILTVVGLALWSVLAALSLASGIYWMVEEQTLLSFLPWFVEFSIYLIAGAGAVILAMYGYMLYGERSM